MSDTPPEPPQGAHGGHGGHGGHGQVGPLALEAALLLDVVEDRLVSMKRRPTDPAGGAGRPGQRGADDGDGATDGDPGTGSGPAAATDARCPECGSIPGAACTACPVCRFIAMLRGERPEATAKLVDGALLIIRTLRSLVPEVSAPSPAGSAAGAPSAADPADHPPPTPSARRGGLEHIDIL